MFRAMRLRDVKRYLGTYLWASRVLDRNRPPHFRFWRGLVSRRPALLADRPADSVAAINLRSQDYFDQPGNREYWLNRPYSDPATANRLLWRLHLLLSALRVRAGDRVLDFGCGTGWTSVLVARLGAEVVGMDIAPAALELAREVADRDLDDAARGRVRFAPYQGGAIPFPDGEFDLVLVNDAFHHFPNPRTLLAEFHRVLGPHGRFAFSEPGIGHAATAHSQQERAHGVLEEEVDLDQIERSGRAAGFQEMEVLVPALDPEAFTLSAGRARAFLRGVPAVLPVDLVREAILTGPLGVLRKGPHKATSLHPRSHRAVIHSRRGRLRVGPGEAFAVEATVTNATDTAWLREGRRGQGYVRLGAHLLAEDGRTIEHDFGRAALPHDVGHGESAALTLPLRAPAERGRYRVCLDLVNEGICWFAQEGSPTVAFELDVDPAPSS
jgi:SAM-dependent methyltransferase